MELSFFSLVALGFIYFVFRKVIHNFVKAAETATAKLNKAVEKWDIDDKE